MPFNGPTEPKIFKIRRKKPLSKRQFEAAKQKILRSMQSVTKPFTDNSEAAKRKRREACRNDFFLWAKTYCPHYFSKEFGDIHEKFHEILNGECKSLNAVAFPREHGKSGMASFGEPIWWALYEISPYTILLSDSLQLASEFIFFIKLEFENNERIIQDFGDKKTEGWWEKDDICVGGKARIRGMGHGQKVRGTRFMQHRPTRIVVDDLENDINVKNKKLVQAKFEYILGAVFGSMADNGAMTMVGTMLAKISVLSLLIKHIREKGEKLKAEFGFEAMRAVVYGAIIVKNGKEQPLWPEGKSLKKLKQIKLMVGAKVWSNEFMNDPIDTAIIREGWFKDYDRDVIFHMPTKWAHFSGSDPSARDGEMNDYKSHVVVAKDLTTHRLYVAEAWADHCSIGEMNEAFIDLYLNYRMVLSGYEVNGFQLHVKRDLDSLCLARGLYPNIIGITHSSDKVLRIGRLASLIQRSVLVFDKEHSQQELLIEQLHALGSNANDDVADALEMAVGCTENWGGTFTFMSAGNRQLSGGRRRFGGVGGFSQGLRRYKGF